MSINRAYCIATIYLSTIAFLVASAPAQSTPPPTVQISNPNWVMVFSDAGYSDLLLDQTPGFEGREYLSGEWAAAVSYTRGGTPVAPTWLEPQFIFPDWTTNSNFTTVNPIAVTAQGFGGLDVKAASTIANPDLRIDLSFEMVDTIHGMPMGTSPASAAAGSSIASNRYVLKQGYTITNTSGQTITDLNLFQFLHALHGVESLYDSRAYAGPLAEYRYDTTQSAVDPTFSGGSGGSGGTTFRDYISFASKQVPAAFDNGRFGVEGIDSHGVGKPSVGVHLAIEADALANLDHFADSATPLWVGGAQKYLLGTTLADGQSAAIELFLGIRTGTVISDKGSCSGSANGGSSYPGGVDFSFEDVTSPGDFFAEYTVADQDEIDDRIAEGEFEPLTFATPGLLQLFEVEFDGEFDGDLLLTFGYDETLFPAGLDPSLLRMFHFSGGEWLDEGGIVDPLANTITVTTGSLSPFALGVVPEPAAASLLLVAAARALTRRRGRGWK